MHRASFLVAKHTAKAQNFFTVGKELIRSVVKDIHFGLVGDTTVQKVAYVPLMA